MRDDLTLVKRYVDDVNVGIEFNQLIDSDGHAIIAEVYVKGSDSLADTVTVGSPTAGLQGQRQTVYCDFSNLPSSGNYILKFRTVESGILATAPLVLFGVDGFSVGADIATDTVPTTDFTLADRAKLDSIGGYSYQGTYNASTNSPDLDTSPSGILQAYSYAVNAAGDFFDVSVKVGDVIVSIQDNPSAKDHWLILQANLDHEAIKIQYESNDDTNEYNDADKAKVDNITVTQAVDLNEIERKANDAVLNADRDASVMAFVIDEDDMSSDSDTKIPTQQSVKAFVQSSVVGLYDHRGNYNASTNSPDLDTSPSGVLKADTYKVSVAGTFFTEDVQAGDILIADQADPTLLGHWTIVNGNLDILDEDDMSSDSATKVPSQQSVKAYADNRYLEDWLPFHISNLDSDLETKDPASDKIPSFETPDVQLYLHDVYFTTDDSNVPTGATTTLQLRLNEKSVFSTQPTIDAGEHDSRDAVTVHALTPTPLSIPAKSKIDGYLTSIGTNPGNNCIAWLLLKKTS